MKSGKKYDILYKAIILVLLVQNCYKYGKLCVKMKLRTQIFMSFAAIVLIPVVLAFIVLAAFSVYQVRLYQNQYGIEGVTINSLANTTTMLNKMNENAMKELQRVVEKSPEKMEDNIYLDSVSRELDKQNSCLLVRKGETLIYNGGKLATDTYLSGLPKYGDDSTTPDRGIYIGQDVQAFVKQIDFRFEDGARGSAFVLIHADALAPQMQSVTMKLLLSIILIMALTSGVLCFWMYRGVMIPLNQLRKATKNIRDGNLDFVVERRGAEEFDDLCDDFEQMRQRLKQNVEEKIAFDKENRELISNISHDLKTPMTAIKGYVEGIMDGVADTPEKMDRYIRTIYNKTVEMDRLINELTFYSKIDTNRIPYTFNKIHIRDYFEDCVEELTVEMESRGVSLTYFDYLDEDYVIIADAEQLKRVINNITSNSLKYMNKSKGVINIRLRDVGDFIQIEIEDNGKGIAPKDVPHIFNRFYRTDASRNSSQGGSGIGLSIVKKIMEDHGGQVWATSKEGTGTTLYLALRKYQEVSVNE